MSLLAAGQLLWVASWRNRVRKTVSRLRQPRYLIGAALVGLYFSSFLGRMIRPNAHFPTPKIPATALPFLDAGLFVVAVVVVLGMWLFSTRSPLTFTEAEVQLLFPAPLTRRSILQYKLVTGLLKVGFGALISAFFFTRTGIASFWRVGLAAWLAFGTVWLHAIAAGLTRGALISHGWSGLRRRIGTLAVVGGVVALGVAAAKHLPAAPNWRDFDALPGYVTHLLATPPLAWLVSPARALVRIALSPEPAVVGRSLLLALAVFAVHYLWVVRSDQAFEESALASAERRARSREARGFGRRTPLNSAKLRKPWLKLPSQGRAEWAIAWKNAVACQRMFIVPLVILVVSVLVPLSAAATELLTRMESEALVPAALLAGAALVVASLGPSLLRVDLRQDVKQLDILRALPLRGWQVVLAELAGPLLLLAVLQTALLLGALILSSAAGSATIGWGWRLGVAFSVLVLAPTLSAAMLLVQNAGVVLFPAWVAFEPGQRGLEAMGQRMVSLAGTLLVSAVGLLPAVLLGGGLYMALRWAGLPVLGVPLAAALTAAVLAAEVALGVMLTGRAFDSLDVSLD